MKLRRDLWIIILSLLIIILWITQSNLLSNNLYKVSEQNLYKLDSIRMLERANKIFPAKSSSPDIEFEDERRKTFLIDGPRYSAIPKNSKLYDTLQYSGLVMTILTDKKGYSNYFNDNNHEPIDVYNVMLDKTSYIELDHINDSEHSRRISMLIFFSIVYLVSLIFYFYYRKKQ